MVNWSDPKEIQKDSDVFVKLIYSLFGLYIWELFVSWDFEWSLITRQRKFRWPLHGSQVFFFLCRYCILLAFIGLIISFSVSTRVNCGALYTFNSWTGNMTILCASTSLMLRTIALWERRLVVVIILGILCVAHWAFLYRGMFIVTAVWDDTVSACVVNATNPKLLNVTFFFTMGFDLTILVFTIVSLLSRHSARTDLWKLLFTDGLVYFLITFTTNSIPAILNVLNLNLIMNVIATVPAACVSSIAACRAVIRLQEFNSPDVYVHSVSNVVVTSNQNPARRSTAGPKFALTRPEVHVTTEHITMAEFSPTEVGSPYSQKEKDDRNSSSLDLESLQDVRKARTESSEYVTPL